MTTERVCPHPRCSVEIGAGVFACRSHWRNLPAAIQAQIVRAWARFQVRPTPQTASALTTAQQRAIDWWANTPGNRKP